MNIEKSNVEGQIDHEQLKQILLRAYMRGENLTNITTKEIIDELAKGLRQLTID